MQNALSNQILEHLSPQHRLSLSQALLPVPLPANLVLFEPEQTPTYVTFVTSGVASIVTHLEDGSVVEVGIVGNEGMPESIHLLGPALGQTECFMQAAGTGLRMKFSAFEQHFLDNEDVRHSVLGFIQYQCLVQNQLTACNRLHEVEQRLARWLLMVADRTENKESLLTQEFLSQMLGTRRSTLTVAAGVLQRKQLIRYTRGRVLIVDRSGLEGVACECYRVTAKALGRFRKTNFGKIAAQL